MMRRAARPAADLGLTLVEMVVVLAVLAVAAGATGLSLAPPRGSAPEAAARRLAATMSTATDAALATGGHPLLVVDAGGYRLAGRPRTALPAGTTLRGAAGTTVGDAARALPLGPDDGAPFDLVVADGRDRWRVRFDGLRAAVDRGADE